MNFFILVWSYLKAKPVNTALNIFLFALGIAVITVLLLFSDQLEKRIAQNTKGIDMVIGAKGSPMQLILCNVFHIDFPTGNIKLIDAEKIAKNRLIKKAIPLALGDSYQSFRIVGTNHAYAELYNMELSSGKLWQNPLEVCIGSNVSVAARLKLGDKFTSTHGLTAGGHGHEEQSFVVTGIFEPTGTVSDNLIFTSVESIWEVHDAHAEIDHEHQASNENPSRLLPSVHHVDSTMEITSLLVQYRSPMAAIQLPRLVNSQTALQAASPAFEAARLFSIMGVGVDILNGFAIVLVIISALSIFLALYNALKERRYDLAIMRTMGATRATLLFTVLLEGAIMTVIGSSIGLLMGHAIIFTMANALEEAQRTGITAFVFLTEEWIILAGSLFLGVVCASIPAIQAYRTDISKVLSQS
jgi:putative ABC transport system permease protein